MHAWRDSGVDPQAVHGDRLESVPDRGAVEQQERARLAERLDGWGEKYPDVRVEGVVSGIGLRGSWSSRRGGPGCWSLEYPGGTRGFRGGPVSHAVLARASCPVAVVNPATRVWTP